jgi:hypothetical protein
MMQSTGSWSWRIYSLEQCYTKLLHKVTDKVVVDQGNHKVGHVSCYYDISQQTKYVDVA